MEFDPEKESYQEHLEKWREHRGCTRKKQRFHTRKLAKVRAKEMTLQLKSGRLSPYKCDYCGYFHIGHNWTSQASFKRKQGKEAAKA